MVSWFLHGCIATAKEDIAGGEDDGPCCGNDTTICGWRVGADLGLRRGTAVGTASDAHLATYKGVQQ